jgi:deoxyribonuclease-1
MAHTDMNIAALKRYALLIAMLMATSICYADAEDQLLADVYSNGGKTLYCQTEFAAGGRVKVDYIYDEKQILRKFGCITSRQCSSKPGYAAIANDLHNLYPIERKVDMDRRGSRFGDLPADLEVRSCGHQVSFQTFDPPDAAKGNVARAMIYMHKQHDLPLIGPLQMYQRWNKLDPPDDDERARNSAISRVQNRRNQYIDNPELIDRMSGL